MNQDILKERYSQYRIKMKSLPKGEKRRLVKTEMSNFLKEVSLTFGQSVVDHIIKKS